MLVYRSCVVYETIDQDLSLYGGLEKEKAAKERSLTAPMSEIVKLKSR